MKIHHTQAQAFDHAPAFYQEDHRQDRPLNAISKEALETKFECLMPGWLVAGKSILDLGACLGAAGQWALYYGAASYVGVEIQADFARAARRLLASWGDQVRIEQTGIREYLAVQRDKSVDVIVAAGIWHCFLDPHLVIAEMCRVARHAVAVEANVPNVDLMVHGHNVRYLQFVDSGVNYSGGRQNIRGLAAILSRPAADALFEMHGFFKSRTPITPKAHKDALAYNAPIPGHKVPFRYFERYIAVHRDHQDDTLLEHALKNRSGVVQQWRNHQPGQRFKEKYDRFEVQPWTFDGRVADRFDEIAATNIPDYHEVIAKTVAVLRNGILPDQRVIDVGCATGKTLQALQVAGFTNLVGVDSSRHMLDRVCVPNVELIESEIFPVDRGPYHAVVANWTLHFIKEREAYLRAIADSLTGKGILILTEKTTCGWLTCELYREFKRSNGLSDAEIHMKEQQLKGVLVPYSVDWYCDVLRKLNFTHVDIFNAKYGFVSFVAQKLI